MCVRYALHKTEDAINAIATSIARRLAAPADCKPRYNVAPSQAVPVVALSPEPEVHTMTWGIPLRDSRTSAPPKLLTNAKAETARTLRSFAQGTERRRCLVPANGFYEWETRGSVKLPHYFTLQDEAPFAFAGIWEPATNDQPATYTVLTTEPNELVATIHHRMPVMLTKETLADWLGAQPLSDSFYRQITRPLPASLMRMRPVNRFVNNSRHEGAQCLESPHVEPPELVLF